MQGCDLPVMSQVQNLYSSDYNQVQLFTSLTWDTQCRVNP